MDESSFYRHLQAMGEAQIIAVDTETTGIAGIKDGRDYAMGISVAYRMGAFGIMSAYFPFRHPVYPDQPGTGENLPWEWREDLFNTLRHANLIFHNTKFDLHSLLSFGFTPLGKLYDTIGISHMVNEELPSYKLDWLSRRYLDDGKSKDRLEGWTKAFGWASTPSGLMEEYACKDAELTLRLFEDKTVGWSALTVQGLHTLWPRERRFTRLLVDIEQRGIGVVTDFCAKKQRIGEERMRDIEDELGFNPSSPIELGEFLLQVIKLPVLKKGKATTRYPEGRPSFDKSVMARYEEMLEDMDIAGTLPEDTRSSAKLILEFRGWQKAVTSLYIPLQRMVSPDGRVRCNFKQTGTVTSRLSCSEPNLQQIPKRTEQAWNGDAKQSFTTREGWTLYGYDYAQLELRLAAAYGKEHWLLEEFAKPDGDVFTRMANEINVDRNTIKTYVYATLYGAGLAKIARTLGESPTYITFDGAQVATYPKTEPTYLAFKSSIAGIGNVSRAATRRAERYGYVTLWTGRRRHFQYKSDCYKAFNSLLQGGGAEVVKSAMIAIDDDPRINKEECRIVLQVHDEIVFDIKDGCREKYEPYIIEHMCAFPDFGVRLAVEAHEWTGKKSVVTV